VFCDEVTAIHCQKNVRATIEWRQEAHAYTNENDTFRDRFQY